MTAQLKATSRLQIAAESYVYKIAPLAARPALAFIASDDSLGILDATSLTEVQPNLRNVHEVVTCLGVDKHEASNVVHTAGRDCTVRGYDVRSGAKCIDIAVDAPLLSLAVQGSKLAAGTEQTSGQASVHIWDTRQTLSSTSYNEVHNDDVTELNFHPLNPHLLLTGSTDGLLNVLDTSIADEDDVLVQVFNHGSSIHRANFFQPNPSNLFGLSHDEDLSWYTLDTTSANGSSSDEQPAGQEAVQFGDVRQLVDCEYVVDLLQHPRGKVYVVAGSHSKHNLALIPLHHSTEQDPQPTQSSGVRPRLDTEGTIFLPGAHASEIVRSICFPAPSWMQSQAGEVVYTAGEDSAVRAWHVPGFPHKGEGRMGGDEEMDDI